MTVTLVSVAATAAPAQEEPSGEDDPTEQALVDLDVSSADGDPAAIAGALGDLASNVEAQLGQLEVAQANVTSALAVLTDRESAVAETEARIEAIVGDSDQVVIRAFMRGAGRRGHPHRRADQRSGRAQAERFSPFSSSRRAS